MKWQNFRRSENVEDYTDPNKPVADDWRDGESINERLKLYNSELAKEFGDPRKITNSDIAKDLGDPTEKK